MSNKIMMLLIVYIYIEKNKIFSYFYKINTYTRNIKIIKIFNILFVLIYFKIKIFTYFLNDIIKKRKFGLEVLIF